MTPHTPLSTRAATAQALALQVLADAETSRSLDALVDLAVARIGADGGQVSVLTDRLVALCVQGTLADGVPDGTELPFEETMCAYALHTDDAVVIPDAHADQRVAGVGAVVAGAVGAYLGVPVRTPDEQLVAVLCVYCREPREWTAAEQADMTALAEQVAAELVRRVPAGAGSGI